MSGRRGNTASLPSGTGDLQLRGLTKDYGHVKAVDNLTLTIPQGSFFALLGASGCGKTTTLRMVAGLEEPTQGTISLGEQDITHRKPYQRPVNTVFQSYALFPHLNVFENVAFGLRRRGAHDIRGQVDRMLALVELAGYGDRKPTQLSGGQQQRVAVARALVNSPGVLLLDEPLGALDLKLRRQMQLELKRIQVEVGLTFVHVTHDQEEAMSMADAIAVMNKGRIEQLGSPDELYEHPATVFVANFLGQSNLLRAAVVGRNPDHLTVSVQGTTLHVPARRAPASGNDIYIGVRPEKMSVSLAADPATPGNSLIGTVTGTSYVGSSTQYQVQLAWGQEVVAFVTNIVRDARLVRGAQVRLTWDPTHTFGLSTAESIEVRVDGDVAELPERLTTQP